MPTSLVGLSIFIVLLLPGLVHYLQRRARVQTATLPPFVETATLVAVSIGTNAVTVALFALVRIIAPDHTPDVRLLFEQGGDYAYPRLGYLLSWAGAALLVSTALAFLVGTQPGFAGKFISRNFAPAIGYNSVWADAFEAGPAELSVYIGLDLDDDSYLGGWLAWYSTEPEETADREPRPCRPAHLPTTKRPRRSSAGRL
jgi:hypothetical protein